MADQANLQVLLTAQNQTNQVFDQARKGLGGMVDGAKNAAAGWTDLMSAANAAGAVLNTGKRIIDEVVGSTMDYASEVRDLGRLIGASAEESSKLIRVADDQKVSYETLSSAMETAIRKGVSPTIDGMGRLSDQYRAIQDPVARTKFLMDNFGKSGADLGPLMELGSQAMREMGAEAEALGLVLTEADLKAARELEIQLDTLGDQFDAIKIQLGTEVIPKVVNFVDAVFRGGEVVNEGGSIFQGWLEILKKMPEGTDKAAQAQAKLNEELSRGAANLQAIRDQAKKNTESAYTTGAWNMGLPAQTGSGGFGSTPGRATGGQVWAGITRMVGENGAEPFTPSQDGWVGAGAAAGGGGGNVMVNMSFPSMFPPSDARQLESILRPSIEAVTRELRRNGSI